MRQNRVNLVLLIIIPPILLFFCALVMIWIPLPRPFPAALSIGRNQLAAILTGILSMLYVVGITVYFIGMLRQPTHVVDNAFAPLGFTARNYMIFGRRYRGQLRGYEVEANFIPPARLRLYHADLKIYVHVSTGTRMTMGQKKPIVHCPGCSPITPRDSDLLSLQIFAQNAAWADKLLSNPQAKTALLNLLVNPARFEFPELYIEENRLWFSIHPKQITAPRIQRWVEDLSTLAQIIETQP